MDVPLVKPERTVLDFVPERGFLLIYGIHALCLDDAAVPVIVYEDFFLDNAAHIQDIVLTVSPVEGGGVRDKDLALRWGDKDIGLDVPERIPHEAVEPVIY